MTYDDKLIQDLIAENKGLESSLQAMEAQIAELRKIPTCRTHERGGLSAGCYECYAQLAGEYRERRSQVQAMETRLRETQDQLLEAQFGPKFADKLHELGFDERLLENYRNQKMRIRELEANYAALVQVNHDTQNQLDAASRGVAEFAKTILELETELRESEAQLLCGKCGHPAWIHAGPVCLGNPDVELDYCDCDGFITKDS